MQEENFSKPNQWTPDRIENATKTIILVIAVAVCLGIFAAAANFYYIAAAAGAAALLILITWQFESTLLIYVVLAFVPWGKTPDLAVGGSGIGKGVYISEAMLGFLLIVWFVRYLFSIRTYRLRSGFHIPIILYLFYSIWNVVHSYIFWDSHISREYQKIAVNIIELGIRFLSAGAFLMIATSITDKKWLKWITIGLLIPGFYNLINSAAGSVIPFAAPWWPLVALFPIAYCWGVVFDNTKSSFIRICCGIITAIAIYVILFKSLGWVSGWIALFGALAAVTYFKSKKLFVAGVVVSIILVVISWGFIHNNVVKASQEEGDYDRFSMMVGAVKYATNFPLGVGLGNYRTYNVYYGNLWKTTTYSSAHGTYSQLLSEMGFPGFILFVVLLVSGYKWMVKWYKKMEPGFSKNVMLAIIGQIVGISIAAFIGDYIIPTYHNGGLTTFSATVYSWLLWGVAVAHVKFYAANTGELDAQSN